MTRTRHDIVAGKARASAATRPSWALRLVADTLIVLAGIALALPLIVLGA